MIHVVCSITYCLPHNEGRLTTNTPTISNLLLFLVVLNTMTGLFFVDNASKLLKMKHSVVADNFISTFNRHTLVLWQLHEHHSC